MRHIVYLATFLGLREYYNMALAKEPASERGFGVLLGMAMGATSTVRHLAARDPGRPPSASRSAPS